jgi:FAD/FMN-containing dehydrogenase
VLGLGVTLASGERTRCGGRVVKNVTGYDLAKLWTGSRGALGVIEDAWLRLTPRPESTAVVLRPVAHATEGVARARSAADLPLARAVLLVEPSLAAHIAGDDSLSSMRPAVGAGLVLVVELAGPADLVRDAANELASGSDALTPHGVTLDAVRGWLDAMSRGSELALRFSCAPSRAACVIESLRAVGASILAHPEIAIIVARFPASPDATRAMLVVDTIRATARLADGGVRVEAGPRIGTGRATLSGPLATSPAPRVADILRGLKQRFDPQRVLAAPVPGLEDEQGGAS